MAQGVPRATEVAGPGRLAQVPLVAAVLPLEAAVAAVAANMAHVSGLAVAVATLAPRVLVVEDPQTISRQRLRLS